MTKPSTIDAPDTADEDSATQDFGPTDSTAIFSSCPRPLQPEGKVRSRRRETHRAVVLTTVSALTLASALAAVVTWSGPGSSTSAPRASTVRTQAGRATTRHRSQPTATKTIAPTVVPTVPVPVPTVTVSAPTSPAPTASSGGAAPTSIPTVGLPAGTVLHVLGNTVVTQAGTVIDGADIRGSVKIQAANVVIRRSRITGGAGSPGVYVGSGSLTLEDTTITGFDDAVTGDNYTATRVEVTGMQDDGFKISSNDTIQDSYCHDIGMAVGAHADCGQVQSGLNNAIVRRNWFDPGAAGNSALFIAPDLGPTSTGPLLVENNVLGGGNFTVQCVDGNNGTYFLGNITLRNNHFLTNSQYGPLRVNVPATISGNVYQATGKPIDY